MTINYTDQARALSEDFPELTVSEIRKKVKYSWWLWPNNKRYRERTIKQELDWLVAEKNRKLEATKRKGFRK